MTSSLLFTKYEVEVCYFGTSVEWWPELLGGDWRELLLESLNQLQNVRLEVCLVVQTSGYDNQYIPLNLAKWFVYSGLSDAIMELFQLFANRSLCRLCAAGNFCVTTHLQDLPHIYARLYYCTSTFTHDCTIVHLHLRTIVLLYISIYVLLYFTGFR